MRQKRNKTNRKVMQLYTSTFNFREPYQVLVDSDFALLCVEQKMEFDSRLRTLIGGEIKPMITQCCMQALYDSGPFAQEAVEAGRNWERRKCNHWVKKTSEDCLLGILGGENKHRYIIATQSPSLRSQLRTIPGLPIVYINRSILLLEQPSTATLDRKQQLDDQKLHVPPDELAFLQSVAPTIPIPRTSLPPPRPPLPSTSTIQASTSSSTLTTSKGSGKRKAKGPNPLSVRKKKKGPNPSVRNQGGKERVRVPMGGGRPVESEEGGVGQKRKVSTEGHEDGDGGERKKKRKREE